MRRARFDWCCRSHLMSNDSLCKYAQVSGMASGKKRRGLTFNDKKAKVRDSLKNCVGLWQYPSSNWT